MEHGKSTHMPQRMNNEAYSTVAQYQAEYRGIVQYYRMAYNLHVLGQLRYVMEVSLVKTLACKYKTACTKIYEWYGTKIKTNDGEYKAIFVKIKRELPKKPLIAYFGGISLKWNKQIGSIDDKIAEPIWNDRNELVQRLLAQECELCGSYENIEVHHIRKIADLKQKGRAVQPKWKEWMIARQRKTLVVCRDCHNKIHNGEYDGCKLSA